MAEEILFGIAEEVLKNLASRALEDLALAWGFKNRLEKLKSTINTIKDVLLDAEERQADSHAIHGWLERLATAVYDADDLFDEVATVASRKQLMGGNKLTKEVHTFFSRSNQIGFAFSISHKIKTIREKLDDIVKDGTQFTFLNRPHWEASVMSRKRNQTMSYVDTEEVIGRDGDKKSIMDMLLVSSTTSDHEMLPVIPVVGMGGTGKTTLAQLIFNDLQVQHCFELRLWVCISDVFDIKAITEKLLMSATNKETQKLEMDQLQSLFRKEVGDKRYLLVLDDVWNENREDWLKLRALLKIGKLGSKILVTTRSRKVAKIMGTIPLYELQGLSKEKSWELFEKVAFEPGQVQQKPRLVKIGEEIVHKCANIPLAIRTLGSLLYGEEESMWLLIRDTSLKKIPESQGDIMSILKISYNHLWSPLKHCFAYCALFPKDYRFKKEMLMDLWMAEGFIIPLANEHQSLEKVAEQYFLTLLHRGFFQDIIRNEWGDIKSCKMHDFMHDLAQQVAGVKFKVSESDDQTFDEKILHLSFAYPLTPSWEIPNSMLNLKRLRTFLLLQQMEDAAPFCESTYQQLMMRFCSLRVLDLNHLGVKNLPSLIDKLIHLRYLNLSNTLIEKLPDSITDLWNLQTLILHGCRKLRTLPTNMRKLTNLRSLDVNWCDKLTHMPSGIEELTLLNKLPRFIVGHKSSIENSAKLSDLKNLNNLRGVLNIYVHRNFEDSMLEATEANLSHKHGLTNLNIRFIWSVPFGDADCEHDEAILEGLKPNSNLRILGVNNYEGQKLPSWARMDNLSIILPNLVRIIFFNFGCCKQLPTLSQLHFLKDLVIANMESVEYMEDCVCDISSSKAAQGLEYTLFFPSLEVLELSGLRNLKGWWKLSSEFAGPRSMQFSKLSSLIIDGCPNLIMLPLCPMVEDLTLSNANKRMLMLGSGMKLKRLTIGNAEDLMSLSNHCLHQLSHLTIIEDRKLESSERLVEIFATLSSSLRSLTFNECHKLRSISKGLEHLTALDNLRLICCEELDLSRYEAEVGMPWKALNTSLRSLELYELDKLVGLPNGLQHLANLHSLILTENRELKELPEWIDCFTSLEYLELYRCPNLKYLPAAFRNLTAMNQLRILQCPMLTERCRHPNAVDWPKIQHIPLVSILD